MVATCNPNHVALDFREFREDLESIHAKQRRSGVDQRFGIIYTDICSYTIYLEPELEIPGYGCEDYFLEEDTYFALLGRWWWKLSSQSRVTKDIYADIGMPVRYAY